jgi:hypothetical protein
MTLNIKVSSEELNEYGSGDLFRVVGRGPKNADGSATLILEPVTETRGKSNAEAAMRQAWNNYVFARSGMAPGPGMSIMREQDAFDALSCAMSDLTLEWENR